ncbi:MAG: glycoside hydrolase family 16 protein [Eubacterium sp.]|nr:glycoside hydrolase family 16 protein [Eubacterium sp.]
MKKYWKRIVASIISITLVISVPIASRVISTHVSADDQYKLVWSDEFEGTSLNGSNWTCEIGTGSWGWGNNEQQYYRNHPDNIEVSDGTLKIHALRHETPIGGKYYTSARMKTQGKHSFKYGKIEAKMRLPRFQGAWPAFWMLGENIGSAEWPACGEMDIMEAINNNNYIYSNLHWSYNNTTADTHGNAYNVGDRRQWHTYSMIWTETNASFYIDDKITESYDITTSAQMEEFRKEQFILLNLAIGGQWPGYDIDNDAFPDRSTMEVDYVRVYQKPEEPTTTYDGPTKIITEDAVQEFTGTWKEFFGSSTGWMPSAGKLHPKLSNSEGYTINITNVGNVQNDSAWSIQGNLEEIPYHKNATYTYKCTLESDVDKKVYVKVADGSEGQMAGDIVQLQANVPYYYQTTVEIPSDFDSTVSLKFGWGKMSGEETTIEDFSALNVQVRDVSFVTTTSIPDPAYTTTPAPTTAKPTTKAPTTAPTTVAPTTPVVTTKTPVVTTKKVNPTKKPTPTTKKKVKISKAKIKKVSRKKKSLKVKLKKIKGVSGYQVRYSDAKNFDGYWEKNTRKTTIKLKKLDRKTKYYIKARGYKKSGNVYVYGKFSKRKKAKTK